MIAARGHDGVWGVLQELHDELEADAAVRAADSSE